MNNSIDKLVDKIFSKVPYSKKIIKVKNNIKSVLRDEYERQRQITGSDIKALGIIMTQYHDIKTVAEFAGYSEEQISEWDCGDEFLDYSALKKNLRSIKWKIIFCVIFGIFVNIGLVNTISFHFINIINAIVFAIPFVMLIVKVKRKLNQLRNNRRYSKEAYDYLLAQSDRYTKRTINSCCIGIVFLSFMTVTVIYSLESLHMNIQELMQIYALNINLIEIVVYFILKNIIIRECIVRYFLEHDDRKYVSLFKKVLIFSMIYWIVSLLVIFFTSTLYIYNIYMACIIIYAVLLLVFNLTLRRKIVLKNIVVNKPYTALLCISLVVVILVNYMRVGSWIVQPYISKVSQVNNEKLDVSYDEDSGEYTITTDKKDFKILQLTDIHLGGSATSSDKDLKALKAVKELIEYSDPDFVIVTGDMVFPLGIMSLSLNNDTPVIQFAEFMRNLNVPWAFIYGNHDTESVANVSESEINEIYKSLSYKTTGNLLYPYVQPDIMGRNNQIIKIRDKEGNLIQALFLMDSNSYQPAGINDYDYIHDDQVEWYSDNIKKIEKEENKDISSMIFIHIPLQQYRTAYDLYKEGNSQVKYYFGEVGEKNEGICCSDYPSGLFDKAVELKSTKAIFCGHDHYNNISLEYQGIRLTYGLSIDYLAMPGIENKTNQRGATLIDLYEDGGYDITPIKLKDIK